MGANGSFDPAAGGRGGGGVGIRRGMAAKPEGPVCRDLSPVCARGLPASCRSAGGQGDGRFLLSENLVGRQLCSARSPH